MSGKTSDRNREWRLRREGFAFRTDEEMLDAVPLKKEESTYLGYGIDILHAISVNDLRGPLFKGSVYSGTYGQPVVDNSSKNEAKVNSIESEIFLEIFTSKNINTEVQTKKGVPFFSGGLSMHYGESRKLEKEARFYHSIVSYCKSKHTLMPAFRSVENIKKVINEDVLVDINNFDISPEIIFRDYGTHLIQEATIGGATDVTAIYNSSTKINKHELKAAVDFACNYVSVKGDINFTEEQKKVLKSTEIRGFCAGGDATKMIGLVNFSQLPEFLREWGASLKDTKELVLAEILKYLPIWELAEAKKRKDNLENAFITSAEAVGIEVAKHFVKGVTAELVVIESTNAGKPVLIQGLSKAYVERVPRPNKEKCLNALSMPTSLEVTIYNKAYKIENDDGTFSFRFDAFDNQFIRVNPDSMSISDKFGDINQLYIKGQAIGEREKFILEKSGDGHKIKSVYSKKYVIIRSVNTPIGSGPVITADAPAANASIFKFKKL